MTEFDKKIIFRSEKEAYLAEKVLVILTLAFTAALLSLLLIFIADKYKPIVNISNLKELFALDTSAFRPEPVERMQFIVGIVSLPFILIATYIACGKYAVKRISAKVTNVTANILYPVIFIAALLWLALHQNALIYTTINPEISAPSLVVIFLVSYFCCHFITSEECTTIARWGGKTVTYSAGFLAFLSASLLCLYGIIDLRSITMSPIYLYSFNAVFHAVVQVFLGKELLVDLIHQYGLYPHFIEPVFRITGLSILSFSILMSVLNGISVLSIYLFMRSIIKSRLVLSIAFTMLLFFCYFFGRIVNFQELYYQYHPVRFIFPSLSILLSYLYIKSRSSRLYYLSFFLYSVAMLWNFDTGFVVFLSWILLLTYLECVKFDFRRICIHLLTGVMTSISVTTLFVLYLKIRYGHSPDFAWAFDYQKLFYINGYFMLPMKMWHPWIVVMFIYGAALLDSLKVLLIKEPSIRSAMLFFLSILGIGIFSYYQGRSHDLNLPAVSYPAFIIFAIYVDSLIDKVKLYRLVADKICLISLLSVCIYMNFAFICNIPEIFSAITTRIKPLVSVEQSQVFRECDFIRANTRYGEELLVLTQLSGVHSLIALSPSPLRIPGSTELILKSDYRAIEKYIEKKTSNVIVDGYYAKYFKKSLCNMELRLTNPDKTLFLFARNAALNHKK